MQVVLIMLDHLFVHTFMVMNAIRSVLFAASKLALMPDVKMEFVRVRRSHKNKVSFFHILSLRCVELLGNIFFFAFGLVISLYAFTHVRYVYELSKYK